MKIKHTPGPWTFDNVNMKIKGSGDVEGMTVIANVSPKMDYSRGMSTQCANAKLIAAAPDLLDACITLIQQAEVCNYQTSDGLHQLLDNLAIKEISNAIKKATE